jgi:DNA processing protein
VLGRWSPADAWTRLRAGTLGHDPVVAASVPAELVEGWRRGAERIDPEALAALHDELGVSGTLHGETGYPEALVDDIEPPAVLFHRGDPDVLDAPRVAIVGTRRCTAAGAHTARALGRDLSDAGVVVVSGLALGIDGAAHQGVLEAGGAPPVGVVGNGFDRPYPWQHRGLWREVADRGLLLGEAPVTAPAAPWRFPARNRIIAALADVVVVVESHAAGGSMHTVDEAASRDVEVMAVPGSVHNPASAGTNRLLQDGCAPVLGADDVLVALGLTPGSRRSRPAAARPPDGDPAGVLDAFGGEPLTLEHLALRTKLPLDRLSLAVHELLDAGWLTVSGGWYERIAPVDPRGAR